MPPLVSALILALVVVIAFALMWLGWRARKRRDATLPALAGLEELGGNLLGSCEIKYIATTQRANPNQRVSALGLGMRGNGTFNIYSDGVFLARDGETDFAILNTSIIAVSPRAWAIDRGVGTNGLIGIDWTLGDNQLTTFVRTDTADAQTRVFEILTTALGSGRVLSGSVAQSQQSKENR